MKKLNFSFFVFLLKMAIHEACTRIGVMFEKKTQGPDEVFRNLMNPIKKLHI